MEPLATGHTAAIAVVSRGPGVPPTFERVSVPAPESDQVLIEIDAVGGCHADIAAHEGGFPVAWPMILGHEGTGIVRAAGRAVRSLDVGDRVVLSYDYCGSCTRCRVGEPTQCLNYGEHNFPTRAGTSFSSTLGPVHAGFFGQSSFATIALASERNAVRVETALPPELLAPLGCGIQTGVGAITHVAQLRSTQTLVIIGMGAVGLAALFAALDAGARAIVAVDTNDSRLTAADQAGAMATIDASRPDWWADVRRIFPEGADVVVESSGAPVSLPAALQCVRSGGTVVVAGAPPFTHETPIRVADLVNRSITIKGTAEGGGKSRDRIPRLVRMVESGALPLALMLEVAQFSDIPAWLQRVSETTPIKPVFRMPQTAV